MKVLIGDLFESRMQTLVNTVNCVGVMGKGVALEFKKRYPEMFKEYAGLCESKKIQPGLPYLYHDLTGASVLLFPTKDHWRSPSRMEYIIRGLDWFVDHYQELGIQSIAFPPLGCGNGGLSWETVGPLMVQKLNKLPIEIEIYAPFGTKAEQLKPEFLNSPLDSDAAAYVGKRGTEINDRWMMILEVIREVNQGTYTLHVGRVIYQKICYILTRGGIQTGFAFIKSWYGPYSKEAEDAIGVLANANLMTEKQIQGSNMIEMNVTPAFAFDRSKYSTDELKEMEKCTDLFCRVKNTNHAEIIATVIYTYDELCSKAANVSEQDVFNGVMEWKKRWQDDKEDEVKAAIRDLAMLGWIRPVPSFGTREIVF